jgi:hypothetical protein
MRNVLRAVVKLLRSKLALLPSQPKSDMSGSRTTSGEQREPPGGRFGTQGHRRGRPSNRPADATSVYCTGSTRYS